MATNHEKAEKDYIAGMKYKEIAEKYDVSINTVKSWKQRYGWTKDKGAHSEKSMHTKSKRVHTKKKAHGPPGKQSNMKNDEPLESDDLTDKQRLFCMYYLKCFNATKAYKKAYDCNYLTANANGSRLLVNASVNKEINRMKEEQTKGVMLDVHFIIQKYIDIAFADLKDYVRFGQREEQIIGQFGPVFSGKGEDKVPVMHTVNYIDFGESHDVDGTIISEVKQGKDGMSIKLSDRMKALKELEKYTDYMTDEDNLKLKKLQAEVDKVQAEAAAAKKEEEETEDDGFLDALNGKASEVWSDVDIEED